MLWFALFHLKKAKKLWKKNQEKIVKIQRQSAELPLI